MLQNHTAKAAIYARRSPEDRANRQNQFRGDGVSDSIETQENICQGGFHPKDEIPLVNQY